MADNFISRGEVLTLFALGSRTAGHAYRESGFNGVALLSAVKDEAYMFQIRGVFEFILANVKVGDLIYITPANELVRYDNSPTKIVNRLFGRAVTATNFNGSFHCWICQAE